MEKEFVPYELAVKLKKLGFDELCMAYFKDEEVQYPNPYEPFKNSEMKSWCVTAPTFSQAFRWFREKYGLHVIIDETIRPQIKDSNSKLLFEYTKDGKYAGFEYEEAELACLEKLIEIIEEKQK
jgi:hypothetical protein